MRKALRISASLCLALFFGGAEPLLQRSITHLDTSESKCIYTGDLLSPMPECVCAENLKFAGVQVHSYLHVCLCTQWGKLRQEETELYLKS